MYILAIIVSQQARIILCYANVSTDPEHKPSFHVLHVKEQHGYIESVVDFTASHVKHRYIESAVGFTASHVKWRVSSLCPVGSIIPSSQHEEDHGAVLVYKEHDHQEQFCFHVFMASNTESMTKVTRQMDQWVRNGTRVLVID